MHLQESGKSVACYFLIVPRCGRIYNLRHDDTWLYKTFWRSPSASARLKRGSCRPLGSA